MFVPVAGLMKAPAGMSDLPLLGSFSPFRGGQSRRYILEYGQMRITIRIATELDGAARLVRSSARISQRPETVYSVHCTRYPVPVLHL